MARLVARLPRARFIPIVYHFFVANLVLFWLLLTFDIETAIVARVFFVWVSVFNLFAVAVFWSFMADLFTSEQGKRLFGFIGAGGTAGALLGPLITIWLSVPLGPVNLLIAAAIFLELAVFCVYRLERAARATADAQTPTAKHRRQRVRGFARTGAFALSARRRRLGRAAVVRRDHHLFRAGQYRFGGGQDCGPANAHFRQHRSRGGPAHTGDAGAHHRSGAQALRHRRRGGALPAVYIVGFAALALMPSLVVVVTVQVVQRWMNFAIANPARQVFFTVVSARGEIQGQKSDRRGDLSRLGRVVWLDLRQAAGIGLEARRYRALFSAGRRGMGGAFDGIRTGTRETFRTTRRNIRHGSKG